MRGGRPLLDSGPAILSRNTPGTNDGAPFEDMVNTDLYDTDTANRAMFNAFYMSQPRPLGQGNHYRSDGARTNINGFEDDDTFVYARGEHLEDQYPASSDHC